MAYFSDTKTEAKNSILPEEGLFERKKESKRVVQTILRQ